MKPIPDETLLRPRWILGTCSADAHLLNGWAAEESLGSPKETSAPTFEDKRSESQNHRAYPTDDERFRVTLDTNTRVTSYLHWQDVRHLAFSTPFSVPYGPGDVLTIYPMNAPEDVEQIITAMEWSEIADTSIRFYRASSEEARPANQSLPTNRMATATTLRDLLHAHLDLNAIPKRSFFSLIAHFTEDTTQKERLLEFSKPEYIDELYDYTTRPRRSILEVLQEFDTVRIPWQWAANVLPELRGRQFSIASGGELKKTSDGNTKFELLVAIIKYKTVIKKIRQGVCTRYLANLPQGSLLDVSLQKGSLDIKQAQAQRPLIMIGPGTGIAPLRSLIWERLSWSEASSNHPSQGEGPESVRDRQSPSEMALFFGCRRRHFDYFYCDEWADLKTQLPLTVFPAFSQDQHQKIYVQDLIKEQSELVYRLLYAGKAFVYVCGSSGKMPQAVRIALTEVLTRCGDMHQGDAESYLQAMEKEGRYKQETW